MGGPFSIAQRETPRASSPSYNRQAVPARSGVLIAFTLSPWPYSDSKLSEAMVAIFNKPLQMPTTCAYNLMIVCFHFCLFHQPLCEDWARPALLAPPFSAPGTYYVLSKYSLRKSSASIGNSWCRGLEA